ncbi:MAG: acetylxylan esterase [Paludibacteraceae bacterium]|nr:acetylxylan esterase [Paludibacteraceae bacterium]
MRKSFLFFSALLVAFFCATTLYAKTAEETEIVLWSGEADLTESSWSQYCTIDAEKALTLQAGDRVAVTVASASKSASNWPSVNLYAGSTSLNHQFGFWTEVDNSATFPITKEEYLCQADIDLIAANGLKLSGAGCNLTKVVRIPFTSVLWEGETDEFAWNQEYTMPEMLVKDLAAGDTVRVTVASAEFISGSKWPTLRYSSKSTESDRKDQYNTVALQSTPIYANGAAYTCPYIVDYIVPDTDLTVLQEQNSLYLTGSSITISKVELLKYVEPTTTLDIETVLYQGNGDTLANWSRNYEQPASVYNNLVAGDILKVTLASNANGKTNCQLRIAWGTASDKYVSWTNCYSNGFPYTYELELTEDQVTAIKAAKALYLNGCNIVVDTWTLTQHKTISRNRGNAATTLWSGSQSINWSGSNEWLKLEATAFTNAQVGHRLRMNFAAMQLGAQGRIVDGTWRAFLDADSYEKLPTAWGDYYEFTLTQQMVDTLQERGLVVSGVGYTLTSVQLIDPLREYVITTSFDTDDIRAWETTDGTPNLSVTFKNYEEITVNTTIDVSLMTDMFADYNTYSQPVELAAGETKTVDIEFGDLQPGFYRMSAKANANAICTYYIGYNPTAIVSPDDSQADFATFWQGWLTELAAIPIDAELTLIEGQESDVRNIYEVKYKSVPETVGGEPVYIYGYYAEPKAEGTYPCIIHFHGTDKSGVLTQPSATTSGWCEFRFSARGQTLDKAKNGSEKYRTDPDDESSVDFYAYRLGDNDEHYYRYVYLDTRRAVDFVRSQAKVNKKNIFAAGGSQGGCLTYVCAALSDGLIRAIAPSITGHADFVHTMEIVGWPTNVFNNWINAAVTAGTYADYETGKAALLAHQSYFDTKNFAKWITCPVITNFSLQDQTDGPHLNIAPYNLLTQVTDKEYSINPFKGHATADDWSTTYMNFFNARIDNTPDTPTDTEEISQSQGQSQKLIKDGHLVIMRDGKEYTILGQITK